ncbi:MAG: flagellar biosynthesis anti-sigma factor FlgM [Gemmatimonadales bacterium]|nr:MAG: flagellar biosynthesis anti-sigma factor FlgM [Gemmatimonadales bacterium]
MTIQPIAGDPLRSQGARRSQDSEERSGKVPPAGPVERPEASDRVDISREGRAQAAKAGLSGAHAEEPGEDRLDAIRIRIQQGTYNTPESAEEVALRLLDSGDLGL